MAPPPPPQEDAIDGVAEAGVEEEEEEDPEVVEPWVPSSDSEPDSDHPPSALEPPPTPSAAAAKPELQPVRTAVEEEECEREEARPRWPGWPGASVFRLVVPAAKVGSVIGRRGETIRRLCDETRARVRVLDAEHGAANRIVLVSATEEVEAELSPAMSATIKIFRHINEIEEINGTISASAPEICFVRLLVPAAQAAHLIGIQGVTVKSIQESTGATIRIISEDELLNCETLDERIVEIHGASLKVHNALKSVLGLLRKFLVDHGVLHLFERKNQVAQPHDNSKENQVINDYPLEVDQDFWLSDQRSHGNPIGSRMLYGHHPSSYDPYPSDICHATDSLMTQLGHANPKGSRFLYGHNPPFCDQYSADLREPNEPLITQITQTMQIPLPYAEQIIGSRGENIEFIRSVSGAVVVLEEIRDYPDEVLVMITGSSSQVRTAHQLLQEVLSGNREPPPPPPSGIFYRGAGAGARLPSSPPHAGPRLLSSPHTCPRWLHSPHAIATSPDLPWLYEDQPPHHPWRYPAHHDRRGYYRP